MAEAFRCDACGKFREGSATLIHEDAYTNSLDVLMYKFKWEICDLCKIKIYRILNKIK